MVRCSKLQGVGSYQSAVVVRRLKSVFHEAKDAARHSDIEIFKVDLRNAFRRRVERSDGARGATRGETESAERRGYAALGVVQRVVEAEIANTSFINRGASHGLRVPDVYGLRASLSRRTEARHGRDRIRV